MAEIYNTMYQVGIGLWVGGKYISVNSSNIISIAILHRYDSATYPIIRVRLYADMALIEMINEDPDSIMMVGRISAHVIRTDPNSNSNSICGVGSSYDFSARAYLENKNIPVSEMDQYKMGERDSTNLNVDSKVPFELFLYKDKVTHKMRQKAPSIYRNMSIESAMKDILHRSDISDHQLIMDPIHNQKRYDQILIPNLTAIESFTFFDRYYGIYDHGGMLYYDILSDKMFLCNSVSKNGTKTIPIYVRSEKHDSDESGLFKSNGIFQMQTHAMYVSVLTESDIERVMNPEIISDTNVNTLTTSHVDMDRLFNTTNINTLENRIEQKNILHKNDRTTLSIQEAARLNERITRVDLSGAGFDIGNFMPNSRINLVFESPIRGLRLADAYRPRYVCHVLTNSSGDDFAIQTTMELCSN